MVYEVSIIGQHIQQYICTKIIGLWVWRNKKNGEERFFYALREKTTKAIKGKRTGYVWRKIWERNEKGT
jgi:hypothetical protein